MDFKSGHPTRFKLWPQFKKRIFILLKVKMQSVSICRRVVPKKHRVVINMLQKYASFLYKTNAFIKFI